MRQQRCVNCCIISGAQPREFTTEPSWRSRSMLQFLLLTFRPHTSCSGTHLFIVFFLHCSAFSLTCTALPLAASQRFQTISCENPFTHILRFLYFFLVSYILFSFCCFAFVAAEEALSNCLQPLCACQYAAAA